MNNPAYTHIISRFRKVSRRYFIIGGVKSFGFAFAVLTGLLCASALCESVLYLVPEIKALLFFSSIGIPVIVFTVLVSLCIIRKPGPDEIARII